MGVVPTRLTCGAGADVQDRIRVDAGIDQAPMSRTWKAQSNFAILLAHGLAWKLASHFRTDDITAIADARPKMRADSRGIDSRSPAHTTERGLDDSRSQPAPAGVCRGHDARGGEQDREAIGRGHRQHHAGRSRPESITRGFEPGTHRFDGVGAMHLRRRGEGLGVEVERGQQSVAVFRNGLGPIGGRPTKVQ